MIIKLHQNLINKIAAGEVVERPASVLKELLENSIDAGAKHITIHLEAAGFHKVEVIDDGVGMSEDDAKIACDSHTTSKIASIEDLEKIESMGFRGEALASIASVSALTLLTKHKDEKVGYKIVVKGGKHLEGKKSAYRGGTAITVKNLFFNVPARKKFLKSQSTEYRHMLSTFFNYALAYPHIHFVLTHNNKIVHNLPSVSGEQFNEELKVRISDLFGRNLSEDLIQLRYGSPIIQMSGFVSHPRSARSTKSYQLQFLNKRPIVDKTISRAVYDAYQGMIPKGKYPIFFAFISINPNIVDVNVHPRKTEVRFENGQEIYRAAFHATKHALEKSLQIETKENLGQFTVRPQQLGQTTSSITHKTASSPKNASKPARGEVTDSILFTKELLQDSFLAETPEDSADLALPVQISSRAHQVFKEVIIVEKDDTLLFIDQHAAAERVTYEKLIEQINAKKIETQPLLMPEVIEVSTVEAELLEEYKSKLIKLGITISQFGKNTYKIDEVPVLMAKGNFQNFFKEILGDLLEDDGSSKSKSFETLKEKIIATMACHGSIRAGMKLQPAEIDDLVNKLLKCNNPHSCPHGRPIMWEISKSELERKFKRPG